MPTERCAKLMAVTMANNLEEVWIAEYPALSGSYLNQYFPNFFRWYVKIFNTLIIEGASPGFFQRYAQASRSQVVSFTNEWFFAAFCTLFSLTEWTCEHRLWCKERVHALRHTACSFRLFPAFSRATNNCHQWITSVLRKTTLGCLTKIYISKKQVELNELRQTVPFKMTNLFYLLFFSFLCFFFQVRTCVPCVRVATPLLS